MENGSKDAAVKEKGKRNYRKKGGQEKLEDGLAIYRRKKSPDEILFLHFWVLHFSDIFLTFFLVK